MLTTPGSRSLVTVELGPGNAVFTGKTDPGGALRLSTHGAADLCGLRGGGDAAVGPQDGRALIGWEGGEEGENAQG